MTTKNERQRDALLAHARELKQAGFRVWVSNQSLFYHYLYAADSNGNLGYCQLGDPATVGGEGIFQYSTVNKPSQIYGTGYRLSEGKSCVDAMKRCCETVIPDWVRNDHSRPQKWTLAEWLKYTAESVTEILD